MSWSLSSLNTYEKCGFKYKLKYIERLDEKRSGAASRGIDTHKTVEDYIKGTITDLPADLSFYTQFLTGLKSYENYPEHKIALKRDWTPTGWDSPDAWWRGVLDLKVNAKENGGTIVYDWKTGKIYPDHDDQKAIYSLAVFSEDPTLQRVRAVHVYLDSNTNREKTFYHYEVPELRSKWENRVQRLEQDPILIPNPGFHCRFCGYRREVGGPCQF